MRCGHKEVLSIGAWSQRVRPKRGVIARQVPSDTRECTIAFVIHCGIYYADAYKISDGVADEVEHRHERSNQIDLSNQQHLCRYRQPIPMSAKQKTQPTVSKQHSVRTLANNNNKHTMEGITCIEVQKKLIYRQIVRARAKQYSSCPTNEKDSS